MTCEDVFEYVDAEPFRPFRIQMASGRIYHVRHPRMTRVGADSMVVLQYHQDDERICERFHMLGLQLVKSIEPIDAPLAQDQE